MKVVLDANVIVAAFAVRGLCSDIFRFAIESCVVYGSEQLLKECKKTLREKIKLPTDKVQATLSYIENQLEIIEPGLVEANLCRDKEDLYILVGRPANFFTFNASSGPLVKPCFPPKSEILALKGFSFSKFFGKNLLVEPLGLAQESSTRFIVTEDKDLLVLKNFGDTKIYTPRQFWTHVQSLKGL